MDLHLHHDFTFQPDGSGRVHVRWSAPFGPHSPDPAEFVRSELQGARGVDAWADVTCEVVDDRLVFAATAWFPDIAALRFHCQGFHCNVLDFAVTEHDGEVNVATRREEQNMMEPLPDHSSEEAKQQWLAAERAKLQMARGFLAELFEGLRCTAILRLPGTLAEPIGGERIDERSAQFEFAGQSLLTVIDRLLTDDQIMLDLAARGELTPNAALLRLGVPATVDLRTAGGTAPAFDYEAEVAAAREAMGELAGTPAELPPSRTAGAPLANPRVFAVKLVREAGERGIQPMGQNFPGISFAVGGDLDAPALRIEEATLDAAVADDGTDLTPADEWSRRISFPKLSEDGLTVWFDVDLPPPPDDSGGLQELRGRVLVLQSRGEEEFDLGFAALVDGEPGTCFSAQLVRCSDNEGTWTCEIQLQVARDRIRALLLRNGDEVQELTQRGYSSCNDECTVEYAYEGLPETGARLCAVMATDLVPLEVPFVLPPIDWLGRTR